MNNLSNELLEIQVGKLLLEKGLKLAVAESCTGGLIGHLITNIPGSSDYYLGSVTAYAYEVKQRILGVKAETLAQHGAVSPETVIEMARGIRACLSRGFPRGKYRWTFCQRDRGARRWYSRQTGWSGLDRPKHSSG